MIPTLRLVGGTSVAPTAPTDSVSSAHAAVLACRLASGLTVEQALRWVCGEYEVYDDEIVTNMYVEIDAVGLSPYCSQDNEIEGYGHIVWMDTLLRTFPELQAHEEVLRANKVLFSPVP